MEMVMKTTSTTVVKVGVWQKSRQDFVSTWWTARPRTWRTHIYIRGLHTTTWPRRVWCSWPKKYGKSCFWVWTSKPGEGLEEPHGFMGEIEMRWSDFMKGPWPSDASKTTILTPPPPWSSGLCLNVWAFLECVIDQLFFSSRIADHTSFLTMPLHRMIPPLYLVVSKECHLNASCCLIWRLHLVVGGWWLSLEGELFTCVVGSLLWLGAIASKMVAFDGSLWVLFWVLWVIRRCPRCCFSRLCCSLKSEPQTTPTIENIDSCSNPR
jgi:hypothetical protein